MRTSSVQRGLRGTLLLAALLGLGACGADDAKGGKDTVGELVQGDQLGLDTVQDTLPTDLTQADLADPTDGAADGLGDLELAQGDLPAPLDTTDQDTLDTAADLAQADAAPQGVCLNEADLMLAEGNLEALNAEAQQCALAFSSIANGAALTVACIQEYTDLSGPCATCFAEAKFCMMQKCLDTCMVDPSSEPCLECQNQECAPTFETCSGLSSQS